MADPTTDVFTYGSLTFPEIWRRVVAGDYLDSEATIAGFERRAIIGEVYPGLIRGPSTATVSGVVYLDISAADLARLDAFEGGAYQRIAVAVALADGSHRQAWAYLYQELDRVEAGAWDRDHFARVGLQRFLDTYCRDRLG